MTAVRIPLVGSFNQRCLAGNAALVLNGKTCGMCALWKEASMFGKRSGRSCGLQHWCKMCKKKYDDKNKAHNQEVLRQWYLKNKPRHRELQKIWSANNKERLRKLSRKYYYADWPKAQAKAEKWRNENRERLRGLHRFYQSKKAALIKAQLISKNWLTEIEKIYMDCPKGFHVDHIVPLRGTQVTGLHVPWNLQYLPAIENIRKGNRYAYG